MKKVFDPNETRNTFKVKIDLGNLGAWLEDGYLMVELPVIPGPLFSFEATEQFGKMLGSDADRFLDQAAEKIYKQAVLAYLAR